MIETSGHGAMRENYCLDDGAYLAVKIIIEAVRRKREGSGGVGDAVADLKEAAEEAEARLRLAGAAFRDAGAAVLEKLREDVEEGGASEHFPDCTPAPVNHEGLRVRVDEGDGRFGWFLLRQSLHDPVCVLNVESEVEGGALATLEKIDAWFDANAFENVDASAVKAKVAELRGARN
jgi:phosphomannomutase